MPPIGYIRVQAVTSRADIPIQNATVTITGTDAGGSRTLLSLQRTDASGFTKAVSIPTPALENSLLPDQAQGWTNVTVTVTHPGFEGIIVDRVQIFPGVTTIQKMTLIPLTQLPGAYGGTERFDVPPQGL